MHQDVTCMEVGLSPGDYLLDGDPSPTPKGAEPAQFSAHIYFGQTAAWIKMPLGTEVGLVLRGIVFDVDPATPRKKGTHPTQFLAHVYCGQTAGWMKMPLGTEIDLGPGHIVSDGGPSSLERGTAAPPPFGPCLLWPRSHISASAELLFVFLQGHRVG